MLGEGEKVPEFELQDADGNLVRSSDLAGRRYVIYFYPRDFTPGCTREADEFVRDYDSFREAEIEVIGISPDDVKSHRKFCDKMGIRFPLLADTERRVATEFGVWGKKEVHGTRIHGCSPKHVPCRRERYDNQGISEGQTRGSCGAGTSGIRELKRKLLG